MSSQHVSSTPHQPPPSSIGQHAAPCGTHNPNRWRGPTGQQVGESAEQAPPPSSTVQQTPPFGLQKESPPWPSIGRQHSFVQHLAASDGQTLRSFAHFFFFLAPASASAVRPSAAPSAPPASAFKASRRGKPPPAARLIKPSNRTPSTRSPLHPGSHGDPSSEPCRASLRNWPGADDGSGHAEQPPGLRARRGQRLSGACINGTDIPSARHSSVMQDGRSRRLAGGGTLGAAASGRGVRVRSEQFDRPLQVFEVGELAVDRGEADVGDLVQFFQMPQDRLADG
jgi:hypothetical protein